MMPEGRTSTKSESALRRTVPPVVANMMLSFSRSAAALGSVMIEVMRSSGLSGSRFTSALPRACGAASGRRQTFRL